MKKRILATLLALAVSMTMTTAFASDAPEGGDDAPVVIELPTASVEELDVEELAGKVDLTYALKFTADEATDDQLEEYGSWYADFVLTLNKDVTFSAEGEADGYLAGQYDGWSDNSENWLKVPFKPMTIEANKPVKIMETAAEVIGSSGLKYTYNEVYEGVKEFNCGLYLTPEYIAENPDLAITLELRVFNNENEEEFYVIGGETYEFVVTELPTATVEELDEEGLTYALKFTADEATDDQLAVYGDWYADYVLTINKDATFSAEGEADGYLSGQYDGWSDDSENWVKVPFKPMSIEANKPVKIMETAAETMDKPGLKCTYREVYEVVKEFNCGVFFTEEYLDANPDLEVTLELRIYHPETDSVSYTIGNVYKYKRTLDKTDEGVEIQGTKLSESTAVEIEKIDVSNVPADTETVTIDTNVFTQDSSEVVDTVTIPADVVDSILKNPKIESDATVEITLANGENDDITVSINSEALEAIREQLDDADATTLTLKVEEIEESEEDGDRKDLTDKQEKAVAGLRNEAVYKVILLADGETPVYTDTEVEDDREIVVRIPYEKDDSLGKVVVKYLDEDGDLEDVPYTYKNNIVTITLSHFSEYVIYQKSGSSAVNNGGGGGAGAATYKVNFNTNGAGAVEIQSLKKNEKATKPADPVKEGYTFGGWYTDEACTKEFSFDTAITSSITLYAKWIDNNAGEEVPTQPEDGEATSKWFSDVKDTAWYYGDVKYAFENGLMSGLSDDIFAPNDKLTRAMFVAILYRAEGSPAVNKSIPFGDVPAGAYYENAVIWAQQNAIVSGVTENEFAPDNFITREQIAAIMFRYAQYKQYDVAVGEDTNILSYDDAEDISKYATEAMQYACGSGLMKGKTETTINPLDNTTRAEVAAVIRRFIEANASVTE